MFGARNAQLLWALRHDVVLRVEPMAGRDPRDARASRFQRGTRAPGACLLGQPRPVGRFLGYRAAEGRADRARVNSAAVAHPVAAVYRIPIPVPIPAPDGVSIPTWSSRRRPMSARASGESMLT